MTKDNNEKLFKFTTDQKYREEYLFKIAHDFEYFLDFKNNFPCSIQLLATDLIEPEQYMLMQKQYFTDPRNVHKAWFTINDHYSTLWLKLPENLESKWDEFLSFLLKSHRNNWQNIFNENLNHGIIGNHWNFNPWEKDDIIMANVYQILNHSNEVIGSFCLITSAKVFGEVYFEESKAA